MTAPKAEAPVQGNTEPEIVVATATEQRLTVRRDLASFEASSAHYPEQVKPHAAWLYQYMMHRCNASPAVVAAQLKKLDPINYPDKEQYIYQVTTGRYFRTKTGKTPGPKAIQALVDIVEALKRRELLTSRLGGVAYNEDLSVWHDVRDYIDGKRAPDSVCKFGAIEGKTGTGKTEATKHYAMLNNHGTTVRFEAPSVPSLARFMMKLGYCYGVLPHVRTHERIAEILKNVNETRTIIVENVQKLYHPKAGAYQPVFSYMQELQDDTGCTFIFTWTPVFRQTLLGEQKSYFEQFISRIGGMDDVLQLDREPTKDDLLSIADQFELCDVRACLPMLKSWGQQAGPLRIIYSRLQKAKTLAGGKSLNLDYLEMVSGLQAPVVEADGKEDAA